MSRHRNVRFRFGVVGDTWWWQVVVRGQTKISDDAPSVRSTVNSTVMPSLVEGKVRVRTLSQTQRNVSRRKMLLGWVWVLVLVLMLVVKGKLWSVELE